MRTGSPTRHGAAVHARSGISDFRNHAWLLLVLAVPFVLIDQSDWIGEKQLHTIMEIVATTTALFVGCIAFVRFRATRKQLELFVAVGFVGTALLDGYHSVVTSTWFDSLWPSPPAALIPWSWNASRSYLALMLVIAMWSKKRDSTGQDQHRLTDNTVIALSGSLCLATFGFFTLVPLPRAYYPELIFGRPEEFVAAMLFVYALIGLVRDGDWKRDSFRRWLSYSLLVGILGQAMYMSRSHQLFDAMFDAAHTLKVISYLAVLIGLLVSVDELYRTEARVASELEQMAMAVKNAADSIAIFGSDQVLRYSNLAFELNVDTSDGESLADLCLGRGDIKSIAAMNRDLAAGVPWTGRRSAVHTDGSSTELEATITPVTTENGSNQGYVTVLRDVTEQEQLAQELEHRATRDALTGLPNRSALLDMLEDSVASRRSFDLLTAVLFLDLDNFKLVNDSLGHAAGDELLVGIGRRVAETLRDGDVVGRLGGDEFLVMCHRVVSVDEAMAIADRIIKAMKPAFGLGDREVHATVSVGVALMQRGQTAEDLLAAADAAAYEAKSLGRDRAELFDDRLRQRAREELETANLLRSSVDIGEDFVPYYQPIVDLSRGEVVGFEALCRWRHPERGLLAAGEFIEVAEAHGMEVPIGWSLMAEVTAQLAQWSKDPMVETVVPINVNISARQLRDLNFANDVRRCIEEAGIDPRLLVIEVTEQTIVSDLDSAAAMLAEIRQFGVKVAIDDFGIGHSSLSYIRSLPIDIVKIDKSFAHSIHDGPDAAAIIAAVIRMTKALGHTIVAEGIETREQMATLQALRCDRGQGYLFSAAVPPDTATALLTGERLLDSQGVPI